MPRKPELTQEEWQARFDELQVRRAARRAGTLKIVPLPASVALDPSIKLQIEAPASVVADLNMLTQLSEKVGVQEAVRIIGRQVLTSAEDNWPIVVPVEDVLASVASFKPEFLPDSIRPWVEDVSQRMSVPVDFAGVCSLVTVAGVIGRRVFVHPKERDKDWKESIALSGAVVAPSGRKKTPTWKTFTNVVVEKEQDWKRDHKDALAKYEKDLAAWEAADKRNKEAEKKGGVVVDLPPMPEEPGPARRLLLNDATPEKVQDVMTKNPTGLLYYRDEMSSWVAELDKDGREGQIGLFLAAMNGNDPYSVDRIGREGGFAIMCASLFGGFQPDMLREFLNNTRNIKDGMIPRFSFLVWPDEVRLPIVDRPINDEAKQRFRRVIRDLADMNVEQVSMHFNPEAQAVFNNWLVVLEGRKQVETDPILSHLGKYDGVLAKIAGLLQTVDLIGNGPLMGPHYIDVAHLNKAIDLLAYLETHMRRIYSCIQDPVRKAEIAITKRIKSHDLKTTLNKDGERVGFTARDVLRKRWHDLQAKLDVEFALENLVEKGWVREIPRCQGPGQPTIKWEINPTLE
jgi:putative DNA primase/helicase